MRAELRARGPLRVRHLLRAARGGLRLRRDRARQRQAAHPGGTAEPLALPRLPALREGTARRAARGVPTPPAGPPPRGGSPPARGLGGEADRQTDPPP